MARPDLRERLLALAQQEAPKEPARNDEAFLQEVKQRQAVEDQRNNQVVNDAVREAERLLRTNPERARELLKQAREDILDNTDISDRAMERLATMPSLVRVAEAMDPVPGSDPPTERATFAIFQKR